MAVFTQQSDQSQSMLRHHGLPVFHGRTWTVRDFVCEGNPASLALLASSSCASKKLVRGRAKAKEAHQLLSKQPVKAIPTLRGLSGGRGHGNKQILTCLT